MNEVCILLRFFAITKNRLNSLSMSWSRHIRSILSLLFSIKIYQLLNLLLPCLIQNRRQEIEIENASQSIRNAHVPFLSLFLKKLFHFFCYSQRDHPASCFTFNLKRSFPVLNCLFYCFHLFFVLLSYCIPL